MICFSNQAWEDYNYWEKTNKAIFRKIKTIIKDILRNPFSGIVKPESLRANLQGYWSRRIDKEHRIVYKYENDCLYIVSCRYHY